MDLTSIILTLLAIGVIGFLVYLITQYIPMPEIFKQVITVVCVVLIILYLLALLTGHASLVSFPTRR